MNERLGPIAQEDWTLEQCTVAQTIIAGPRGALVGPFVALLRSPELMEHAQRMGEYLRYRSALEPRLSELAILVVARQWTQQVEWAIHAPIALGAGVPQAVVDALAAGVRPHGMDEATAAVYDFSIELHQDKRVSDGTYAQALALLGERGVVDLMGLNGYYTLLAMVMNGAQTKAPTSSVAPLR